LLIDLIIIGVNMPHQQGKSHLNTKQLNKAHHSVSELELISPDGSMELVLMHLDNKKIEITSSLKLVSIDAVPEGQGSGLFCNFFFLIDPGMLFVSPRYTYIIKTPAGFGFMRGEDVGRKHNVIGRVLDKVPKSKVIR
jgi:hypothetical protein|tara:strand:+ start:93 stop:506 length:414 start_codon:yes stop_codon:yes gene_type:complete